MCPAMSSMVGESVDASTKLGLCAYWIRHINSALPRGARRGGQTCSRVLYAIAPRSVPRTGHCSRRSDCRRPIAHFVFRERWPIYVISPPFPCQPHIHVVWLGYFSLPSTAFLFVSQSHEPAIYISQPFHFSTVVRLFQDLSLFRREHFGVG